MSDLSRALLFFFPTAKWTCHGDCYEGLEWLDETIPKPTEEQVCNIIRAIHGIPS